MGAGRDGQSGVPHERVASGSPAIGLAADSITGATSFRVQRDYRCNVLKSVQRDVSVSNMVGISTANATLASLGPSEFRFGIWFLGNLFLYLGYTKSKRETNER